jgi:hypothetical protein
MIRGDDALSSLMDEMSGSSTTVNNSSTKCTDAASASASATSPLRARVRIRLMPEVEGYGETSSNGAPCPETGQDGNIWNPNVCTNLTPHSTILTTNSSQHTQEQAQTQAQSQLKHSQQLVPPTNPLVEIVLDLNDW